MSGATASSTPTSGIAVPGSMARGSVIHRIRLFGSFDSVPIPSGDAPAWRHRSTKSEGFQSSTIPATPGAVANAVAAMGSC
jgi:hypothetical protein